MIQQSPKKTQKAQWSSVRDENGQLVLIKGKKKWLDPTPDQKELLKYEIVTKMTEGLNFTKLCKIEGMPSRMTIFNWMDEDPKFKVAVEKARKIRADAISDKFEEVAEKVTNKNDRPSRVKADVYKHLMSIGDRERFGPANKDLGDRDISVSITFNTGIDRSKPIEIDVTPPKEVPVEPKGN